MATREQLTRMNRDDLETVAAGVGIDADTAKTFENKGDLADAILAAAETVPADTQATDDGGDHPDTQTDVTAGEEASDDGDTGDHQYTAADLEALDNDALYAIAGDVYGIDPETHESRSSLIVAILNAQSPDDDTDGMASEQDDEHEPDDGLITIRGKGPFNRTALFDRDRAYRDGQVFIQGGETARVPRTRGIDRALRDNRIEIVS